MEIEGVFEDSARRRLWILTKALETLPLTEALRLAQTVEDFLLARDGAEASPPIGNPRRPLEVAAAHHTVGTRFVTREDRSPSAEKYAAVRPLENAGGDGVACDESDAHEPDDPFGIEERLGEATGATSASDDLAVLASPDDIVRFLRQRDDVVVRDGETYLVNGRFRESLGQLAERANRIRARERLPAFQLMPMSLPQQTSTEENGLGA